MLEEIYNKLKTSVPEIPKAHLTGYIRAAEKVRNKIILHQRASSILLLVTSGVYPESLIPPKDHLFTVVHQGTDDLMQHVQPQQIQYISTFAQFIARNPSIMIRALEANYKNRQRRDFYIFMIYSTIPAFFGFFTSGEHISDAFPFYCSLVGTSSKKIVDEALIPFFCNGTTFRFIENVCDIFFSTFCYDSRLDSEMIQNNLIVTTYVPLVLQSIKNKYPLLPQPHQFILRFMITRGWSQLHVLHFFLHSFALPQLLRVLKATPYYRHFFQFKYLCVYLKDNMKNYQNFCDIFSMRSNPLFEVPLSYTPFQLTYTTLLLTPLDVHCAITSLQLINELPANLRHFVKNQYFDSIDLKPFWIKIYSKKPKIPQELSANWRQVVFNNDEYQCLQASAPNPDFKRLWCEIQMSCEELLIPPVDYLLGNATLPLEEREKLQIIKKIIGDKYDSFVQYSMEQNIIDLQNSANNFEHYLMHQMILNSIIQISDLFEQYYNSISLPIIRSQMTHILSPIVSLTFNSTKELMNKILRKVDSPQLHQIVYMMIIQHFISITLPSEIINRMRILERKWQMHLEEVRETIVLPKPFHSTNKGNSRKALLLHQKLWMAVENIRNVNSVPFEWTFHILFKSLKQLDELVRVDDCESTVIQFAIAFSDCSKLISRVLFLNNFVMKQKYLNLIENENDFLWPRLEIAVLHLLSKNNELMEEYLTLQDELVNYRLE